LDLSAEACAWVNSPSYTAAPASSLSSIMTAEDRINIMSNLADTASSFDYAFAWPVFYPTCISSSYDSNTDLTFTGSSVYSWISTSGISGNINNQPYSLQLYKNTTFSVTPFAKNISSQSTSGGAISTQSFWQTIDIYIKAVSGLMLFINLI
jgi:hypothetical protein